MKRQVITTIAILSIAVSGCISATDPHKKAKQGAAVGAASGAVLGAVVGNQSGSTGEGAAIGAVVGAGIGTAVGWHMDKQQAELEEVPGIDVTRPSEDEIGITINNDILYDVDSSTLRSGSRTTLNEMAGVFAKYPDTMIELYGHADSTGTAEHNQLLSAQRAQSVGNYLVRQGVSSSRIDAIGYGESDPVETNDTASGRQANRRVEIKVKAQQP
ncbi:MAG: OmpA family protein [Thermoanaerobaculia bacterium]|jgi:outer membrane protein OmpA-like peptidoglycan-associated protein